MGPVASATSEGAPATRRGWRRLGAGPRPRPCSGLGQCQAPPGPSGVPWQAQGVSSRGACEARPVGRGRRGRGGGQRGEGAGCTPGFLPTSCLPSRGTRTTAPTSSAGPPAPAPPGRSAWGGTPRPHGRPSTAAAQVLGPSVSSAPNEAAPLAFPLTSLSLVCDGSDGCWDVGAPGGDRELVRLPHQVSLAPCREALCRGSQ